jgi:hypothetical protein
VSSFVSFARVTRQRHNHMVWTVCGRHTRTMSAHVRGFVWLVFTPGLTTLYLLYITCYI